MNFHYKKGHNTATPFPQHPLCDAPRLLCGGSVGDVQVVLDHLIVKSQGHVPSCIERIEEVSRAPQWPNSSCRSIAGETCRKYCYEFGVFHRLRF